MPTVAACSPTSADLVVSRYLRVGTARLARSGESGTSRVVWSTRSGRALPVSSAVAAALASGRCPDLDPVSLQSLKDAEILVPRGEIELDTIVGRLRRGAADRGHREFTLLPTAACNMGCAYCGQTHARGDVGTAVRSSMQARVLAAIADPQVSRVSVRWFGGEPMLAYRHLLAMGAEQRTAADRYAVDFDARIVTNGVLLSPSKARRLHSDAGIGLLNITLDGPGGVHDRSRPTTSGRPSFARITQTIADCLADPDLRGLRFLLRTNVTRENGPHVASYLRYCRERGFDDPRVTFELARVHSWSNGAESLGYDQREFGDLESSWLQLMHELGLRFAVVPGQPKAGTCVAVKLGAEVLSASGRVFSCTEKPLVAAAEAAESLTHLSLLATDSLRPAGPYDDWIDGVEAGETDCRRCAMLGVCGGSCPKLWREGSVPCPSYKANWDARLTLLAQRGGYEVVVPERRGDG